MICRKQPIGKAENKRRLCARNFRSLTRLLRSLSTEQYRAYRDKCDRTFRELSAALNRSAAVRSMDEKQRLGVVANAAKLAAALSLERHSAGQGA